MNATCVSPSILQPFFSIDSDVEWPEPSSCHAKFGPGGETIISSVEGRATLTLSSSGEDFSVELMCSLSRPGSQHQREPGHGGQSDSRAVSQRDKAGCLQATDDEISEVQRRRTRNKEPIRARSCSPQMNGHSPAQSKVMLPGKFLCFPLKFLSFTFLLMPSPLLSQRTYTSPPQWSSITPAVMLPPCGGILSPWPTITGSIASPSLLQTSEQREPQIAARHTGRST